MLIKPILLGPKILRFPFFARFKIFFSSITPFSPASLKPPESMVAQVALIEIASLIAEIIFSPSTAIKT